MSNKLPQEMDDAELLNWACGYLTISIGQNNFRGAVSEVLTVVKQIGYLKRENEKAPEKKSRRRKSNEDAYPTDNDY